MAIQASAGARVGDYILVRKLGEGGMAEVWLARHVSNAQLRAIKFLNSQFQGIPEVEARFQNEGESKLIHPNIVRIYEVGQEAGSSYLVMEFVDGQDLESILNSRRGPLTVPEALDMGIQILSGLGFAHSNGIVHRDIKPSNVLVDREGHAYVMDFGIAKVLRTGRMLTQVNSRLGTPDYMSPEQIRNPRDVDYRSDIYSFGCLFYELLTGWPPFDRGEGYETEHDIKTAHVSQAPTAPMLRKTGLPAELNQITLRCLAKSQSDRPQSCEEVVAALMAYRAATARPQAPARPDAPAVIPKPSTGPGAAPRRETVVLPNGGATEAPPFTAVPGTPQVPAGGLGGVSGGYAAQVRTPTLIDTVPANPTVGPTPPATPYTPQPQYVYPSQVKQKGAPTALIVVGILLVLVALGGGGWVLYQRYQDAVATQKREDDQKKADEDARRQAALIAAAKHNPSTDPKQAPEVFHQNPPPPQPGEKHPGESPRPGIESERVPNHPTVKPPPPVVARSGTLIWTGDATTTKGHVTIVRSGNFAMPGGQLSGAMFPAAALRVTVRTPGATVQLPDAQRNYNSLELYLPSSGPQTVTIDWTEISNP